MTFFLPALFDEILYPGAHLIVVRRELPILIPIKRFIHRAGTGQREDVRHLLFNHRRQHCVVVRRAAIGESEKDIVMIEQLVHRLHGFRHDVLHVLDNQTHLAAMDAAFSLASSNAMRNA